MKTLSIQWHITSLCNNQCKHCYMFDADYDSVRSSELGIDELRYIYSKINDFEEKHNFHINSIAISGGDPLLKREFYDLLPNLYSDNRIISILGNPETVTPSSIDFLIKYNVTHFQLSLDGLQSTHDMFRQQGSFERTLAAQKVLSDNGINTNLMYTLSNENADDLIPLINELERRCINSTFAFDFMVPVGNACSTQLEQIAFSKMMHIIDKYISLYMTLQGRTTRLSFKPKVIEPYYMKKIMGKDINSIYDGYNTVIGGCYCGWSSISILPNGDVLPCRRLPIVIGNLLVDSLADIFFDSPLMRAFRRRDNYDECKSCTIYSKCRGCPAIAFAVSGSPFSRFPYCVKEELGTQANYTPIYGEQVNERNSEAEYIDMQYNNATTELAIDTLSHFLYEKILNERR